MRRLALVVLLATASLACHQTTPPAAPNEAEAEAELDRLVTALRVLDHQQPTPEVCEELELALAGLRGVPSHAQRARYARAELALRCGQPETWRRHHQQLADAGFVASVVTMLNDAVSTHDWERATLRLEQLRSMTTSATDIVRLDRLEAELIHGRWVDWGEAADFEFLEQGRQQAVAARPRDLDARAALMRLYVEAATLTGESSWRLLAQLVEGDARVMAGKMGVESARFELEVGLLRALEGRRSEAIAAWTHALELNEFLLEPRLWLGLAAIESRDFDEAYAQLQCYVTSEPDHVDALLAFGVAARGAGHREQALAAYARATSLDPRDPRAHWNAARAWDPFLNWTDDDEEDISVGLRGYEASLASFRRSYRRVGPRACPARGEARPDPACEREAAALVEAAAGLPVRFEAIEAMWELLNPHRCWYDCEPPDPGPSRGRIEELRALEKEALEAGQLVEPSELPEPEPNPDAATPQ